MLERVGGVIVMLRCDEGGRECRGGVGCSIGGKFYERKRGEGMERKGFDGNF